MDYRVFLEWDEQCGILLSKTYSLREPIEEAFESKNYGKSINTISVVMTCMGRDLKPRKRFKKDTGLFEYDILLDYYLIKNVGMEQKKEIIREQIVAITEQTFSKYKFEDFDKAAFLSDLKEIVNAVQW